MSQTTPEYDESVFNALDAVRDFERELESGTGNGYDKWMIGRRITEFEWFAEQQAEGIHEVAHFDEDYPVCTCGLVVALEDFDEDSSTELKVFLAAPGHWDHVAGAVLESGEAR